MFGGPTAVDSPKVLAQYHHAGFSLRLRQSGCDAPTRMSLSESRSGRTLVCHGPQCSTALRGNDPRLRGCTAKMKREGRPMPNGVRQHLRLDPGQFSGSHQKSLHKNLCHRKRTSAGFLLQGCDFSPELVVHQYINIFQRVSARWI